MEHIKYVAFIVRSTGSFGNGDAHSNINMLLGQVTGMINHWIWRCPDKGIALNHPMLCHRLYTIHFLVPETFTVPEFFFDKGGYNSNFTMIYGRQTSKLAGVYEIRIYVSKH